MLNEINTSLTYFTWRPDTHQLCGRFILMGRGPWANGGNFHLTIVRSTNYKQYQQMTTTTTTMKAHANNVKMGRRQQISTTTTTTNAKFLTWNFQYCYCCCCCCRNICAIFLFILHLSRSVSKYGKNEIKKHLWG